MKAKYLSRAQAFAMCHDYQHLRGAPLDELHTIHLVLVAPYSRILQWQYVQNVLRQEGDIGALSANNPAGRYDVLLIAIDVNNEQGFTAKDLRTYLASREIPFKESRYACLRSNNISMTVLEQILG